MVTTNQSSDPLVEEKWSNRCFSLIHEKRAEKGSRILDISDQNQALNLDLTTFTDKTDDFHEFRHKTDDFDCF